MKEKKKEKKYTVLINRATNDKREVKNGMAWTVFFFTIFALLFRKQFKLAGIFVLVLAGIIIFEIFVLEMIFGIYVPPSLDAAIGMGLGAGFGSVANDSLIKQLQRKGYVIYDPHKIVETYAVSAFCKDGMGGNKAGVVLFDDSLNEEHKKAVAAKLGYSETAFVTDSEKADFKIEYFTPSEEVPLCGHATIATFALMQSKDMLDKSEYTFETKEGVLVAKIEDDKIFMEQSKPKYFEILEKNELVNCFDIDCISTRYPIQIMSTGLRDIIIPIYDEKTLYTMKPNFSVITNKSRMFGCVGIHAFALERDRIICRNFAPLYDIPEESATGTANCALVSYLYKHDIMQKEEYVIEQGYTMNSPSEIIVKIETDAGEISRIFVGGKGQVDGEADVELFI